MPFSLDDIYSYIAQAGSGEGQQEARKNLSYEVLRRQMAKEYNVKPVIDIKPHWFFPEGYKQGKLTNIPGMWNIDAGYNKEADEVKLYPESIRKTARYTPGDLFDTDLALVYAHERAHGARNPKIAELDDLYARFLQDNAYIHPFFRDMGSYLTGDANLFIKPRGYGQYPVSGRLDEVRARLLSRYGQRGFQGDQGYSRLRQDYPLLDEWFFATHGLREGWNKNKGLEIDMDPESYFKAKIQQRY